MMLAAGFAGAPPERAGRCYRRKPPAPRTHRIHHMDQAPGHAATPVSAGVGAGQLGWQPDRMRLVAHFRQLYLALPLLGPAAGFLRQAVVAVRTADALLIEWRCHILGRHGMATGVTLIEGARCQVMAHGDRKSTRLNSSHVKISYA